ncbi:MAG TPA: LysR family transcriptional regulator [Stellaceae bacterium]|jgi:DNA-binding transcriptional LysR family regulator|nr:LysR family transcriptional regulator [Stellaceae bacterium]
MEDSGRSETSSLQLERLVPSLLSLITIMESGSINKAAELLHVSQPALTRNITKLEQRLKVPLLERSPKGVSLTPFGLAVLERAKAVKAELMNAVLDVEALKSHATGRLRIGATPMVMSYCLPTALEILHKDAPQIGLQVTEGIRPHLLGQLRLGHLDIVVSTAAFEGGEIELTLHPLFELELAIVVRPKHPLAGRYDLTLGELAHHQWILPRADSSLSRHIEKEFKKADAAFPRSSIQISSPEAIKSLISVTDLVALIPSGTVQEELANGTFIALRGAWSFERRTVAAFLRPGTRQTPLMTKLMASLRR